MTELAPVPNYVDQFSQAFQTGREMARQKGVQNALSMAPTDPGGAASALMQYGEFQGANALMQNAAQQRALKTQQTVSPMIAQGDYAGAAKTAAAGGAYDVASEIGKLDDQQREHAAQTADVVSRAAYGLAQLPQEQRADGLQKLAPMLLARGVSQDQINSVDLSDQGLAQVAHQAMSIKDTIASQQKDAELKNTAEHNRATEALTAQEQKQTAAYHQAELAQGATRLGIEAQSANRAASQVLQDKDGTPYVYNTTTKSATTLDGQPYAPQGAQKIMSGMARSASAMATQRFLQEHPDATSDDIATFNSKMKSQAAAWTAFNTGKQGQTLNSINVGVDHLETLKEAANALHNGNIQIFNQLGQNIAQQTGKAAPINFDTTKQFVGDEIVKSITGGAGGVGDREKAQAILSRANSPDQLAGAISQIQQLMAGQVNGLRLQYKNSTHADDFEEHLLPATRAALEQYHPANGSAVAPASSGARPPLSAIFGH